MTIVEVQNPFEYFTNSDGSPLDGGAIYIGKEGMNAETNPVPVFFDQAATEPASQPISTAGGFPYSGGSPKRLYVDGGYSIQVRNEKNITVYSSDRPEPIEDAFDTFADFIASENTYAAGTLVEVRDIQATYRAVAGTGTGNLGQANAGGQEFDIIPDEENRVAADAVGCAGNGAADDTAKLNRLIDAGFEIILSEGKSYLYSGTSKAISGLKLSGTGTLLGAGQSAFVWGEGGDIKLTDVTIKNFDNFIYSDTTGLVLGDVTESNVTWDNVTRCYEIVGTGSVGHVLADGSTATNFTKAYNFVMYGFKSVKIANGNFDAELGWNGTSAVTHTGQRWVSWIGNRDGVVANTGPVWIADNKVQNVVTSTGRADGFLVQMATSVFMCYNEIEKVLPAQANFIEDGYLEPTNSGSGLYSSESNTKIFANTLKNAGITSINCIEIDDFYCQGNTVLETEGWTNRGIYCRANSGNVCENHITGTVQPIFCNDPNDVTYRNLSFDNNTIVSPKGGLGVVIEGPRAGIRVRFNEVSDIRNTHPLASTQYLCAVLWSETSGTLARDGEAIGNRMIDHTDSLTVPYKAAVIMAAEGTATLRRMAIKNNRAVGAEASAVGLLGGNSSHEISGNSVSSSVDVVAIWGGALKSFVLGENTDGSGNVNPQARKIISPAFSATDTEQTISLSGIFDERVLLTRDMVSVRLKEAPGNISQFWLDDFTNTSVKLKVDAASGVAGGVRFDVIADLTGQRVTVAAVT